MAVCRAEMVAVTLTLPRMARPKEVPTWREALTTPDAASLLRSYLRQLVVGSYFDATPPS